MSAAAPHWLARALVAVLVGAVIGSCTGQLDRPASPNPAKTGGAGTGTSGGSGVSGTATGTGGVPTTGGPTGSAGTGAGGTGAVIPTGAAGFGPGAAGTGGGAGTTGAAGAGGFDAGAAGGGVVDGGVFCQVTISPASPTTSFFGLEYGPGAVLRAHATVAGYAGTPTWDWKVGILGVAEPPPTTLIDDTGSTIEIKLTRAGKYTLKAEVVGAPECNRGLPVVVPIDNPSPPSFVFRVTPPSAARLPILETTIKAGEIAASHGFDLGGTDSARVVSLVPLDPLGFPLPSYVRLTGPAFDYDLEAHTKDAPFVAALAANLDYQVLIVPDAAIAPQIVRGTPDLIVQKMAVTQGMPVAGEARDGAGYAVEAAHAILRGGDLPSTLGVSDANGIFGVFTRPGTLSAVVAPPPGSGLPEAHVPADPGIDLRAGTKDMKLVMRWAASPAGPLTLTVRGTDGTTPVAGARVRVESSDEIPSVGTLTVHASGIADVDLAASGSVRANAITDAKGVADMGMLRAGSYRVTVAPQDGDAAAATTSATFTLPATGLARDVRLSSLVTVAGALTPADRTAGTRVTAIDLGILAPVTQATAIADASGRYSLRLAPSRTYELLVEPPAGRGLARAVVAVLTPGASPAPPPYAVPEALRWSGTITSLGRRLSGSVVQVFCGNCLDTTLAVAQGVTRSDGTLELVLPAPATSPPP